MLVFWAFDFCSPKFRLQSMTATTPAGSGSRAPLRDGVPTDQTEQPVGKS